MSLSDFDRMLEQDHPLRRLKASVAEVRRLQQRLDAVLPAMCRGHVAVARLHGETLVLVCRSAVWATRVRQIESSLLESLRESGLQVTAIRIRMQVEQLPHQSKKTEGNLKLSDTALSELASAAGQVSQPEVREALTRLLAKRGRTV